MIGDQADHRQTQKTEKEIRHLPPNAVQMICAHLTDEPLAGPTSTGFTEIDQDADNVSKRFQFSGFVTFSSVPQRFNCAVPRKSRVSRCRLLILFWFLSTGFKNGPSKVSPALPQLLSLLNS